jgi:VRR-NUC domain
MGVKSKVTPLTKATIRESALKELTWRGYDCWRQNNIAVRGRTFIGRRGVSDIIGITKDGRWVVTEVKTLNDTLSPDQITFLNDIKKAGGEAYIACQEGNRVVLKEWEVKTI